MAKEERTPVGISVNSTANVFVVCDDGTVWVSSGGAVWTQQSVAIPGTKAAIAAASEEGVQTPFR